MTSAVNLNHAAKCNPLRHARLVPATSSLCRLRSEIRAHLIVQAAMVGLVATDDRSSLLCRSWAWKSFLACFTGLSSHQTLAATSASVSSRSHATVVNSSSGDSSAASPSKQRHHSDRATSELRIQALFNACKAAFGQGKQPTDAELAVVQDALGEVQA